MNIYCTLPALCLALVSCQPKPMTEWVSTTVDNPWQVMDPALSEHVGSAGIVLDPSAVKQTVEGFGTCLNELGWLSLAELSEADRAGILEDLFTPEGMGLTMARMPVGANDFSVDFYSYDEVDGDFALEHFSIDRDREALLPFIRAAKAVNPALKLWASPWCPPMWMKVNAHYASRTAPFNGLSKEWETPEGTDAFKLEPAYLEAYARYFGKFIDAYKAEGIDISMVMPQNEPNSDQVFPSCTWTPDGLIAFLKYLEPEMNARGVDVYLGTMERADPEMWDRILTDPVVGPSLKGMGFQWAGKDALPELHRHHPSLPCYQTEQECGDGRNDWRGAMHSWDLMKHYFSNGVQGYFYWNTSLLEGGISTWMWRQNSLVTVDKERKTFRYTPEYYVLKHASHYVRPGAKVLDIQGGYEDALAFLNPDGRIVLLLANQEEDDGRIVLLLANQEDVPKTVGVSVRVQKDMPYKPGVKPFTLPANSINTILF